MLLWGKKCCGLQKHSEPLREFRVEIQPSSSSAIYKGAKRIGFVVLMVTIVSMRQQFKNASQEIKKQTNSHECLGCTCPGAIQYCGIGLPNHQVSSTIMSRRDAGIPSPFRKVGLVENLMEDHTKELPETACFSKWQQSKEQRISSTNKQ